MSITDNDIQILVHLIRNKDSIQVSEYQALFDSFDSPDSMRAARIILNYPFTGTLIEIERARQFVSSIRYWHGTD